MDISEIKEGSVVCFRYSGDCDLPFVLFSKLDAKLAEAYRLTHVTPLDHQKVNREPTCTKALYKRIELEDQTLERLRNIYDNSKKTSFKIKIFEHNLFMVLYEP